MAQGRDLLLYISTTGIETTAMLEVPLQGDLSINPGKTITVTKYKNGQSSAQNDAGWTASFEMGNTSPVAAAEQRVWSAHDTGEMVAFEIRNSVTGGMEWTGVGYLAIQTLAAPTSGPTTVSVQLGADGTPTRGVAAA